MKHLSRVLALTLCVTGGLAHHAYAQQDVTAAREVLSSLPHNSDGAGARLLLADLAASGNLKAQIEMARIWSEGVGVEPDPARAAGFWRLAADQGHAASRYRLARALIAGDGIAADPARGVALLRAGVDAGHRASIAQLAKALETGVGGQTDHAEAVRLYEVAAGRGDDWSRYRLALALTGPGAAVPDPARAEALLSELTARGYRSAPFALADLLMTGRPSAAEEARALALWLDEARAGNDRAMARLARHFPNDYVRLLQTALDEGSGRDASGMLDRATIRAIGALCMSHDINDVCRLGPMRAQAAREIGRILFPKTS